MERIIGFNILGVLEVTEIRKVNDTWFITYRVIKKTIEPEAELEVVIKREVIRNWKEVQDLEGNVIQEANPRLDQFESDLFNDANVEETATRYASTHAESIGLFVEYVDNSTELWEGEELPETVKPWVPDEAVAIGFIRSYEGDNYVCLQKHTTEGNWTPDVVPALWKKLVPPFAPWVQPTGAHDAYNIGDKVTHNGHKWESLVDGNVWEPSEGEGLWTKLD